MTKKESTINNYFWSDFSKIYKNPELIDNYLIKNSDLIEKTITNSFVELELNRKLFNLCKWWLWKKRDVSII
jgi:hypothetical protein